MSDLMDNMKSLQHRQKKNKTTIWSIKLDYLYIVWIQLIQIIFDIDCDIKLYVKL